jgi:hypothetical protein
MDSGRPARPKVAVPVPASRRLRDAAGGVDGFRRSPGCQAMHVRREPRCRPGSDRCRCFTSAKRNHRRDLDLGAVYHLNQANPLIHAHRHDIDFADSVKPCKDLREGVSVLAALLKGVLHTVYGAVIRVASSPWQPVT